MTSWPTKRHELGKWLAPPQARAGGPHDLPGEGNSGSTKSAAQAALAALLRLLLRPCGVSYSGSGGGDKPKQQTPEELEEIAEAVLAYAWQSFNNRVSHFDKLDSKAATLASFVGISISLGVGFAGHLPPAISVSWVDKAVAALLLLMLLVALFLFLLALQTRAVKDMLPTSDLIRYLRTVRPPLSRLSLLRQLSSFLSLESSESTLHPIRCRALQNHGLTSAVPQTTSTTLLLCHRVCSTIGQGI